MSVKDNRTKFTANSQFNALSMMIKNHLLKNVFTADVVMVTDVQAGGSGEAAGWVTVKPLVCQVDNFDERIEPVDLFRLPYSRIQGGTAAVVIDPAPGDIGIAIYTKRDSSLIKQKQAEPVRPGSFRTFDQSDGFYIGGFLNKAPTVYLEMMQDNTARLVAPESITLETTECTINTGVFTVNASEKAAINSPEWAFNGRGGTGSGRGIINADLNQNGSLTSTGEHSAAGVNLSSHTHGGVETGGANTGRPN